MSAVIVRRRATNHIADQQLADQIRTQLAADSRAVSRLQIAVEDKVVTMRGVATSFYQKQLWLHGAKRAAGGDIIINDEISVTPRWEDTDFGWRD